MNPSDYEDIFLDNEKTSFQNNFDEMTEEPNRTIHSAPIQISDSHENMPHAFPQDTFNQFYGNFAAHNYQNAPEWFLRNKKLPGLSGFVTLEGFDHENQKLKESELGNMDIQSLIHQDFNLNLGKFFKEDDNNTFSMRASENNLGIEEGARHMPHQEKGFRRPSNTPRNDSKGQEKLFGEGSALHPEKMSFFREYLPLMLEHHWQEVLENSKKFSEFETDFDTQKNAENLMFLEEHKETYGNAFENIYHSYYGKIIGKMKNCVENYSMTGEAMLKILYDELCGLLADLFTFLKNCTSDYCFGLMKNKTNNAKTAKNTQKPANMAPVESNNTGSDTVLLMNGASNVNGAGYMERAQAQQKQTPQFKEPVPINFAWNNHQLEENKGELAEAQRNGVVVHQMSIENLESLAHLIDYNVGRGGGGDDPPSRPGGSVFNSRGGESISVAPSEIESVVSENTRRSQRKYWSAAELQELDNLSIQYSPNNIPIERLEEFARKYTRTLNAVQSKISKTKKEKVKRQNGTLQVDILPMGVSRTEAASAQNRYEVSVEKMIKGALQQFPGNNANKDDIVDKIKEMFFRENVQVNDDKLRNSISQTLSSSRSITRIKGTYGLTSRAYLVGDIANAKTMKSRLQYILTNVPNHRADIDTIRRLYWNYFHDTVDADKVWETSIAKILKQSNEFDTSNCKTRYCLFNQEAQG